MLDENLLFWLWLTNIKGIGIKTIRLLLDYFRSPESVYRASRKELKLLNNINDSKIDLIVNSKDIENAKLILDKCNKQNIRILTMSDSNYPEDIRELSDIPVLLYYRGNIIKESIGVSIVGSRRCTDYGKRVTQDAAEFLAANKIPVISGMAKGIDGYAHTACLNIEGYTIAFLGCGVDICYPSEHLDLMKKIIDNGAVISEYPPCTRPQAHYFPERNRLISAWCKKLLVVEAGKDSGALITARLAKKYNRIVYSVPNSIYSLESVGTNKLINNGASIYVEPEQLLLETNTALENVPLIIKGHLEITEPMEIKILNALGDKCMTVDELLSLVDEDKSFIIEQISIMELEGKLRVAAGGRIMA